MPRKLRRNVIRRLAVERLEHRRYFYAGQLDASFGDEGKSTLDFFGALDTAHAVATLPDGSSLVAGSANEIVVFRSQPWAAVARFDPQGELDPGFGEEGIALFAGEDGFVNEFRSVVTQDDKILVAGTMAGLSVDEGSPVRGLALLRLLADGSLDPDFNDGEPFWTELSSTAADVVVQPDGKIVVVGDAEGPLGFQIALIRLTDVGALDREFGDDGQLFTNLPAPRGAVASVALDGQEIIVTATIEFEGGAESNTVVARYLEGGSLDSSFGDEGLVVYNATAQNRGSDTAVQADGGIVVAGSDAGRLMVLRYLRTGELDNDFGEKGVLLLPDLNPVIGGTTGGAVAIQQDQRIVVTSRGGNDFVVLRLNSNGTLDTRFNGVGRVTTDVQNTFDSSNSVALFDDGRIVVAGVSGGDWAVVRYLGDGLVWQNSSLRFDVDNDLSVVPFDILRIINELIQPKWTVPDQPLPASHPANAPYFDVDGNGYLTTQDALHVINYLLRPPAGEAEGTDQWPGTVVDADGWITDQVWAPFFSTQYEARNSKRLRWGRVGW